jgi:hypothetical protein
MNTVAHAARRLLPLLLLLAAAACAPRESVPVAGPQDAAPPVVRKQVDPPSPQTAPPLASAAPSHAPTAPPSVPPTMTVVVPPEAIYVCVTDRDGRRNQTVIEFAPKVHALCRRHPEMGPCQYERNVCRAGGGRVYAASGQEITLATEAEYDKRVRRVRFQAK